MDNIAREAKQIEQFGSNELWRKATRLVEKQKPSRFAELVVSEKAINWLTLVVRDQGFAHGLPEGNRSYPERQWLSREELDNAIRNLTDRYEAFGASKIFHLPSPLDVLFCWVQLGDGDKARQLLSEATRDDAGFLNALEAMRSWQNSSDTGVTHPLRDEVIGHFFNIEEVRRRLVTLGTRGRNRKIRKQSQALLSSWQPSRAQAGAVAEDVQHSAAGE
jgi:hypothetical protein